MPGSSRPTNKLFVEGNNDLHTVLHVVMKLRPDFNHDPESWFNGFKIDDCKNDQGALKAFCLAARSSVGHYGLVIDADSVPHKGLQDRWDSIVEGVHSYPELADVLFPAVPPNEGWISVIPGGPTVGAWIMPDNQHTGAIEAFLTPLVPSGDQLWTYADTVISTVQTPPYNASFKAKDATKAKLHSWLAWREEPGRPYGRAIDCDDLHVSDDVTASTFVDWFERLFTT
jgi:hypothetical protein